MDPWKYFSGFDNNKGMTLFVMILPLLFGSVVGGRTRSIRDIEPQKRQNMPPSPPTIMAIKTIQSEDGDIIDCVDIHKQPAVNHPLLKNHSIQMQPSFYQRQLENTESEIVKQTWQKSGSCPEGTIPIQRNRNEGLSKDFPFSRYGKQVSNNFVQGTVAYTTQGAPYYGTTATLNPWSTDVDPHDFSSDGIVISDITQTNYVSVGWGVWPPLFGDSQTRLSVYWTAGESTGCYNLLCSGFVQVSNKITLGGTISPVSSYGGAQHTFSTSIKKDDAQSSWWVEVLGVQVGYWHSSLFKDLNVATLLIWGGFTYNSNGNDITQLGSGHFANEGYGKAAFIEAVQAMDSSRVFKTPSGLSYNVPLPNCYNISQPGPSNGPGASFYYGGPGGSGCE